MGFASPRATDEHHIISSTGELAAVQLTDQDFINFASPKVEAGQIAISREACRLQLLCHRTDLPLGPLCLKQLGEHGDTRFEGRRALLRQFGNGLGPCRASSGCAA
jgi:hypothetical protein